MNYGVVDLAIYVEDLHLFGEIRICYIPSLGYNRTSNKGRIGLYLNLPINHPRHTFKFFNPYTKKVFTSKNVTWTGLTWGEYEKISLENYFYKTVVVLDSYEENEDKRLINVNRANIQRERIVEVSNVNNEENGSFNSGRGIKIAVFFVVHIRNFNYAFSLHIRPINVN